jgi:hypothetical protein
VSVKSVFKRLFGRWEKRPQDQTFYVKIFFAVITAIISAAGGQTYAGLRGLLFGVLMYVLAIYVIVYLLDVDPKAMGGRQRLVTNSLASYLLMWVVLWTLFYAFAVPPSVLQRLMLVASCTSVF